jgi:CRISPR-associated endonuclease/helicase Cas3
MPGVCLYAHSAAGSGARHTLEDHLRGSAALARRFGEVFGAGEIAEYLALVHDVGKGVQEWQNRLLHVEKHGGRVGVPHKHAGTWLAARNLGTPFGAVVFGHHGGLPDASRLKEELRKAGPTGKHGAAVASAVAQVAKIVPQIHPGTPPQLPAWLSAPSSREGLLRLDLLLRMVFSCVVDADFLDTHAHFADAPVTRLREAADFPELVARYEARRQRLLADREPSPVDAVRQEVYQAAGEAAAGPPGMYVLHVPTGGAKTLACGGFALRHAAQHGMRRVVLAVPFISITEQNAAVYRELLDPDFEGPPVVLEHHSAVDLEFEVHTDGAPKRAAQSDARPMAAKLAAENWDAPFVVTTTVRLFESLFSNRPSDMRRLHRLAGSVIVLDEVQALPDRLLTPILSVLRGLVEDFGVTVLLASATQPSFRDLEVWKGLVQHQIVAEPVRLFDALRRVRYEWRIGPDVTLESIAEEASQGDQSLTVVSTTKDAARYHRHLEGLVPSGAPVLHLSTRMTAGHRREVIVQIRDLLRRDEPVHVVSTSLIEAGVDFDFPRVFRAWAPAESLQQAAGRCNRDGRLTEGVVVVFAATDANQPGGISYRAALDSTGVHFGEERACPDDLEALQRYYRLRYAQQQATPLEGLGADIDVERAKLNFPEVASRFQMIEDGLSRPVLVIRPKDDRDCIERAVATLRSPYPCGPEVLRGLQPHIASLPRGEADAAVRAGFVEPIIGDLLLWTSAGGYQELRGLDPDVREDWNEFMV